MIQELYKIKLTINYQSINGETSTHAYGAEYVAGKTQKEAESSFLDHKFINEDDDDYILETERVGQVMVG